MPTTGFVPCVNPAARTGREPHLRRCSTKQPQAGSLSRPERKTGFQRRQRDAPCHRQAYLDTMTNKLTNFSALKGRGSSPITPGLPRAPGACDHQSTVNTIILRQQSGIRSGRQGPLHFFATCPSESQAYATMSVPAPRPPRQTHHPGDGQPEHL